MFFSSNIRLLRKRMGRTQDDVAHTLNMKRSTLSGYENQVAQPGVSVLIAFSNYFNVTVDSLLKVDLSKLSENQISQLEQGFDVYVKGSNLRVLVSTVDAANNENIELVPEKAKAGYVSGFADPEYVNELPVFQLPFLSKDKKYRTFQIAGDSMLPIPDKSWVTGEFVQNWQTVKSGELYIVVTQDEGVVFKLMDNHMEKDEKVTLCSLNPLYEPFDIGAKEIKEVWRFVHFISETIPEPASGQDKLLRTVADLSRDMAVIKNKFGL